MDRCKDGHQYQIYVSTRETITELSVKAADNALAKWDRAKDLDLILCTTMKGDYACPSLACLVQRENWGRLSCSRS